LNRPIRYLIGTVQNMKEIIRIYVCLY